MDFARKMLEKYGWKDGDGLGKECQGMAVALKPHLKTGKEGMGFDLCKDLTDTWWTKAYSDCLDRINVTPESGLTIRQEVEDPEGVKESKSSGDRNMYLDGLEERPMEKMRRRMKKANFTSFSKGGTLLTNGELVPKHENKAEDEEESKQKTSIRVLSDEELLKACGGRTAHKAARFGLKLNGKLARIAAQEEQINLSCDINNRLSNTPTYDSTSSPEVGSSCSSSNSEESLDESSKSLKKKEKDKKRKRKLEDITETLESLEKCDDTFSEIPSKKKKKSKNTNLDEATVVQPEIESLIVSKDKTRKSKKKLGAEIIDTANLNMIEHSNLETLAVVEKRKKKKSKQGKLDTEKMLES